MNCRACGAPTLEGAAFCSRCGVPLAAASDDIGQSAFARAIIPVGRSGYAIAAGYVALFAMAIWPLGIGAVLLAIKALRDMKRDPEKHGKGRAYFAIVVGGMASLLTAGVAAALIVHALR